MAVNNISRGDLDQFLPQRRAIRQFIEAEVEWLADQIGNIIGIVAKGTMTGKWGYAVLRRDEQGKYQYWDLKTGIDTRDAARLQMVRTIEATQPIDCCSPLVGCVVKQGKSVDARRHF